MFVPVNHQVVLCGESLLRQNDFIYFGVKKMVLLKKKRTTQDTINIYIYFFLNTYVLMWSSLIKNKTCQFSTHTVSSLESSDILDDIH